MSGRITTPDLEQAFTNVVRLATTLGADTDNWVLVEGQIEGATREPWSISDSTAHPVVLLGYTKRDALAALAAMGAILRAVDAA